MFNALVVEKDDDGKTSASVQQIGEDRLPEGDVTVAVEYSTVNYKDGLCVGPGGGLVRNYPHVPGIDFAGTVEASDDGRYKVGDKVVLTGWRVGEAHDGGGHCGFYRDAGGHGAGGSWHQGRASVGYRGRRWGWFRCHGDLGQSGS